MRGVCESLMAEHDIILQVLEVTEKEIASVQGGKPVNRAFFENFIGFVREFTDGVHHHKEELILFPLMVGAGIPKDGGPIGVMLKEHEAARAQIASLEQSLDGAAEGDEGAKAALIKSASAYCDLLKAHIDKENHVLFPMADHVFDSGAKANLLAAFEEAEANDASVTKRRRAWAESLF